MRTSFIPAKKKYKLSQQKILEISKRLPKDIAIAYSIQYKEIAHEIQKVLSKNHKITNIIQVLGCSKSNFPLTTNAILLISDGKFHAISLAHETKIPVYIFNNNNFQKISESEINLLEKKQKSSYLKFLNADKIGIIVSTKPGQEKLKKAAQLKKHLRDKKSYLFLGNEIIFSEFENFPQIQSWVNTACPRVDMNAGVVDLNKII